MNATWRIIRKAPENYNSFPSAQLLTSADAWLSDLIVLFANVGMVLPRELISFLALSCDLIN